MDVRDLAFIESHNVQMMFYPQAWDNAQNTTLQWVQLNFPPDVRSSVPHEPGVYAFIVEPELFSLQAANGLFYVGKATDLYNRIGSYISELSHQFSDSTRPHIWRMLNQWSGRMRYYYSTTVNVEEAEVLEDELLKAFRPPFNKKYPAEISQVMRAF